MLDENDVTGAEAPDPGRPGAVLATTDEPVPLDVREIADERVPDGMRCLGTFLDGTLVARCAVPPGAVDYFIRHGVFSAPRQLVLAAREQPPADFRQTSVSAAIQHAAVYTADGFEAALQLLDQELRAGDVVLVMSAGDAVQLSERLFEQLQDKE